MDELKETLRLIVRAQLEELGIYEKIEQNINELIREAVSQSLAELARKAGNGKKQTPEPVAITGKEIETSSQETKMRALSNNLSRETGAFPEGQPVACYVYGIVRGENQFNLGPIGINDSPVYTLPAGNGLCAVIHHCVAEAYVPPDDDTAKRWLFTHQAVLDKVQEQFGPVLPMGFNNIVFLAGRDPREVIKGWLGEQGEYFSALFQRLARKQEFGVKVLVEEEILKRAVLQENEQLRSIKAEMESKPEGIRYMHREKLERTVLEALEQKAASFFDEIYATIRELCADIQVEKTKKPPAGKRLIASFACLVAEEKAEQLGQALAGIERREGFTVEFTGPWPPYSFVGTVHLPG